MAAGDDVLELWRDVQLVHLQVTYRLHRGLLDDVGIGYQDYVVLTEVSEGPKRLSDLASRIGFEKSRLSHQIDRLERQGLVQRRPSEDDRRSTDIAITASGRRLQRQATPGHRERVESLFSSKLTAQDRRVLGAAAQRILAELPRGPAGS